jgi:hypothetical protein
MIVIGNQSLGSSGEYLLFGVIDSLFWPPRSRGRFQT